MQLEHVNLNQLVADHLRSYRQTFNDKVSVDFMSEEGLENVWADPVQIHQVLTFLFDKAKSTMPDGGGLILLTRNVKKNPFTLHPASVSGTESYVMLSVTETGNGMDDSSIDGILEPCSIAGGQEGVVATELSVVNGMVREYKGGTKVRTAAGEGTTFQFFFPSSVGKRN